MEITLKHNKLCWVKKKILFEEDTNMQNHWENKYNKKSCCKFSIIPNLILESILNYFGLENLLYFPHIFFLNAIEYAHKC
jgi:hypothetical protein